MIRITNEKTMLKDLEILQKRCTVRAFTKSEQITNRIEAAETLINDMITNISNLNGNNFYTVTISAYNGGRFPNAYKGRPETTYIKLIRIKKNNYKYLTSCRDYCNQSNRYNGYTIRIEEPQTT